MHEIGLRLELVLFLIISADRLQPKAWYGFR